MGKIDSLIRLYLIGGFSGVPGLTDEKILVALRQFGFPKVLDEKVKEIIKEVKKDYLKLRSSRSEAQEINELVEKTGKKLFDLLKNWQGNKAVAKKKGRGNYAESPI